MLITLVLIDLFVLLVSSNAHSYLMSYNAISVIFQNINWLFERVGTRKTQSCKLLNISYAKLRSLILKLGFSMRILLLTNKSRSEFAW